jgi:hypothetical protein
MFWYTSMFSSSRGKYPVLNILVDFIISRTMVFTHVMGGVCHQDLCLVEDVSGVEADWK